MVVIVSVVVIVVVVIVMVVVVVVVVVVVSPGSRNRARLQPRASMAAMALPDEGRNRLRRDPGARAAGWSLRPTAASTNPCGGVFGEPVPSM